MTLTTYPVSAADSPDLTALSLSRLVHRLELNLLVPSADLSPLRQSEFQRMRVGAVRSSTFFSNTPLRVSRSLEHTQSVTNATELATSNSHQTKTEPI